VSLVLFRYLRHFVRTHYARRAEIVSFRLRVGQDPGQLVTALHELPGVSVRSLHVETDEQTDQCEVVAALKTEPRINLDAMLATLAQRTDVDEMSLEDR
jgi:hypothetical protein